MTMLPALTVVANIAPNATKAPPRMLRTSTLMGSVDTRLTPLSSARAAMVAGRTASNVTITGGSGASASGGRSFMGVPSSTCARGKHEPDHLYGDHLHDRHGGKDHRVADIGPLGRRHPGGIHQDRRVSGRARCDAD